jgi:outer membrane protein assembly factor BamB
VFQADGNFRHSTPAIAEDGTIYIGGADGLLYAVNPDGSRKWTFTAAAPIKTSPNFGPDGTIYFGADDGLLYAVNPDSTLSWTFPTGDMIRSSPAVAPDSTIVFGSLDQNLYALRPDGSLRWSATTGDIIKFCSPAVDETNTVYFGSYDGFLYAVRTNEEFVWAYPTGHVLRSSPALGPDGTVYIGAGEDLLAIGPGGSLEWSYGTNGDIYASPVFFGDDEVIGIGSTDGVFHCVNADGSDDWTFTVGTPIRSTVAPGSYGNIYVADLSGVIWAFGSDPLPVQETGLVLGPTRYLAVPNPAGGEVAFRALASPGLASYLNIFDLRGKRVATLRVDGMEDLFWNGRDQSGQPLPTGVYLYRLEGQTGTGRVTLIR